MRITPVELRSSLHKNLLTALIAGTLAFGVISCSPTKNTNYFQTLPRDTILTFTPVNLSEAQIRPGDQLSITVSSLNPVEDAIYNAAAGGGAAAAMGAGAAAGGGGGYLVDASGNIQMHRLGLIQAAGMSRKALKEKLEKDLSPYLKDAVVNIRYLNHRVTIIGEVRSPQVVQMPEDKLTIIDLMAGSGDLTEFSKKDNILIIRDTKSGKQFKRVNLEDHSIFNTEWYYMQPDDVVYIEPSDKKIKNEKRARVQQTVSFALSGLSLAIIILDRIFR